MNPSPEDFVSTVYRRILLREADPESLSSWTDALRRKDIDCDHLLTLFLESREFGDNFPRFEEVYRPPNVIDTEKMNSIAWWHSIELGGGVTTPGRIDCRQRLADAHIPADLTGKTVLDIGAWDGYFSFECERRGAARVVALDHVVWNSSTVAGTGKAGFDFAHAALGSAVEQVDCDVYDLDKANIGTFDIVLFLGVLYHIKDPFYVMHRVAPLCRDLIIVETHVDFLDIERPAIGFYEGDTCASDPTNWCGPNRAALDLILRDVGFSQISYMSESPPAYDIVGEPDASRFGRAVVHARRA